MFEFNHFILLSPVKFVASVSYDSQNSASRGLFHSIHVNSNRGGLEKSSPRDH
jgi:hypothetical protein